jgi:hypothetical protein
MTKPNKPKFKLAELVKGMTPENCHGELITGEVGRERIAPYKPNKQTTSAVSSIAGRYARMKNVEFDAIVWPLAPKSSTLSRHALYRDIRKLAASCLAQDEVKGTVPKTRAKSK